MARRQVCVKNMKHFTVHQKIQAVEKDYSVSVEKTSSQLSCLITRDLRVETSLMCRMTMGTFTCNSHILMHERIYNGGKPYMCNVWPTSLSTSEPTLGRSSMNVQSVT